MSLEVVSILGDGDLDHLGEVLLLLPHGGDSCGEDKCIDGDLDLGSEDGVVCLHDVAIVCGQVVVNRVPEEFDTELACPGVELLAESVCPDVLVDDGHVGHGVVHLDLDCHAQGCCTADTRTVVDGAGPGSDTLDEHDVLCVEAAVCDLLLGDGLGHDLCVASVVVLGGLVCSGSDCEQDCSDGGVGSIGQLEVEVTDVSGDVLDLSALVDGDEGALLDLCDCLCEEVLDCDSVLLVAEVACESSELVLPLDEVDRVSLCGDVECCGHSGDSSTDNCCGVGDGDLGTDERLEQACLGDGHPEEVLCLLGCCLGLVHVDPGTLVTDVCHVAEVLVQSTVPACLPEEGLVGPGGTGCDDDPVQVVLGDGFGDCIETVLCTSVLGLLSDDDVGESPCVLCNGGDIDGCTDVDTAVTDPDSDTGLFALDVLLLGVDLGCAGLEVLVDDPCSGLCGGSACLGDGGGDVLGCCECTGDEDSGPGGLEGVEDGGLTESVLVELDSECLCELLCSLRGCESDGQDCDVELLGDSVVLIVGVVDDELLGHGVFLDVGDACSPVHLDSVLFLSPVDVCLELLSVGPDIHEEDVLLEVTVLLGDHCLLGGVHTTNG